MQHKSKHIVYLGLGTNQGDKSRNIERAIEMLSLVLGTPLAIAPNMESEPWGYESKNNFLNTVVAFGTSLSPLELLETTEETERQMGRKKKSDRNNYCDRIIDIDILFYDNIIMECERLTIPHPLLHKRMFVLQPLHSIAPNFIHPVLQKEIGTLMEEFYLFSQE